MGMSDVKRVVLSVQRRTSCIGHALNECFICLANYWLPVGLEMTELEENQSRVTPVPAFSCFVYMCVSETDGARSQYHGPVFVCQLERPRRRLSSEEDMCCLSYFIPCTHGPQPR